MSDGSVSPRLLSDVLEDGVSRRRFLARTSAATAVIAAGCSPGGSPAPAPVNEYERGNIRTDTGSFLDKGTFGVDPVHPDFSNLQAVNNGSVDAHDAFTRAQVHAALSGLAVAPSSGTYHVASNLSINSPLQLRHGALLKPASGITIAISGHLDAPGHEQVFDLSAGGTVVLDSGQLHNVRWWGASPSAAAADNATALQAAINSAVRQSRVARIYVPAGLYPYSKTLTIPDTDGNVMAHVILMGEGAPNLIYDGNPDPAEISGSILHYTPADGTHAIAYELTGLASSITAFTFEDIQLNGPESPSSGDGVRLIGDHDNARLVRVAFKNFCVRGFAGGNGLYLEFCENGSAVNLTSCRNKYGVTCFNASNANSFVNLVCEYNTTNAMRILDCTTIGVFGGLFQHNDRNGLYINGSQQCSFYNIHFEANNVTAPNNFHALHIEGTNGMFNHGNTFVGCRFAGANDSVRLAGHGAGNTNATTFIGCRDHIGAGQTIADANVIGTTFVTAMGGTLTDNGTLTAQWGLPNTGGMAIASYLQGKEISDPGAPAANAGVLYFRDNGAAKTQLVARFPTGAVQVIATEP